MSDSKIHLQFEGDVAVITIDGPEVKNALGPNAARNLSSALDHAGGKARAVLITGVGGAFCSGANLLSEPEPHWVDANGKMDAAISIQEIYNPLTNRFREMEIPIVSAVIGPAAGFGCGLALLGDIIIAGQSAYFMQAFCHIGLVPDGNSTYILPRLIGKARAMEMALFGEKIDAEKALDWGLVNRVVADEDVLPVAKEFAARLAKGAYALGQTRRLIWDSLDADWYAQAQHESLTQRKAAYSQDYTEGTRAFREKRTPSFKGM